MTRILLYGATGFSGTLIAREAARQLREDELSCDFVLGGRDRFALARLSDALGLPHIVFALDDRPRVESVLSGFNVIVNAAGPFVATGGRLAKSAIATGCHYVDISGEVDVYQALDDLGRIGSQRQVALVSGGGFTSTVSDVLLDWALTALESTEYAADPPDAIRIAVTPPADFSRGSVATMLRSVREEVLTVRQGAFVHVPVGRHDRAFDFGPASSATHGAAERRIASAANLLDTLTAFHTASRHGLATVGSIESFADVPRPVRLAYQLGAVSAAFFQTPLVQRAANMQIAQLAAGPDQPEREATRQTLVLQIDSACADPLVDWRIETPNCYEVTARCAVAIGEALGERGQDIAGWQTPAAVLQLESPVAGLQRGGTVSLDGPLTGSALERRPTGSRR